ncbi:hypothetical protein Ddye_024634 [Dipteronia dyeriana]|uniref:Pentatricopeptide repeat-containing protein n=1 Tax=Dipteronia dyeriana TaxID=168575 RepID=A0AAD9WTS6_9ROSI|nr:hypothetical protein Ddye_024634 [Dipteronia dyeriana]
MIDRGLEPDVVMLTTLLSCFFAGDVDKVATLTKDTSVMAIQPNNLLRYILKISLLQNQHEGFGWFDAQFRSFS